MLVLVRMGTRATSNDFDERGVAIPRHVNERVDPILRAIAALPSDADRRYIRRWIARWIGPAGDLHCATLNRGATAAGGRVLMRRRAD